MAKLEKDTNSGVVALYTILGSNGGSDVKVSNIEQKTKFGWIIMVTPTTRKAYPIDAENLEKTVFDFRNVLRTDRYNPKPLASELYNKLFRQTSANQKTTLENDLTSLMASHKDKTLMWSLDGILRYVPMAALHDGEGYLVEKYKNVIFTKESFLTLSEKDVTSSRALGLGLSEQRETFAPLPGVERELHDIVRIPGSKEGILDGTIRLNNDFTEESALRLWREDSYPIVHIASHYSFNVADPKSSFLLVGDGRVTFAEMQDKDNIFGKVDLLTLSACDTAMGAGNGKEAEGFAYLAQSLGAKAVIASLWPISDAGTSEFMVRFYTARNANANTPKGEGFRQAQLSLIKGRANVTESNSAEPATSSGSDQREKLQRFSKNINAPYSHPYYWAPFVLIGNWR